MKKILPLMVLVSSVACGDTYNSYATGEGAESITPLNTCEDVINKYYACGLQEPDDDHDYEYLVNKCKNKGWMGSEWKACFEAHSCEDIKAGVCKPYATG